MSEPLSRYFQHCFSGANLPASMLLLVVLALWLGMFLLGLGLDFFDFDLLGESGDLLSSIPWVVRFTNLSEVPLGIWVSLFAAAYWLISVLMSLSLDPPPPDQTTLQITRLTLRNLFLAAAAAKLLTQPLRGVFSSKMKHSAKSLVGRTVTVTSSQADHTFGQAEYVTGAAPLQLHVRTREKPLLRGDAGVIVEYDAEQNIYWIQKDQ